MENISLLNREPNFRNDICYRVGSNGVLCNINKENVSKILEFFDELKKNNKSISNIADLRNVIEVVRQRTLAKIRVLKKQENGGYVLISSVTAVGILVVATIIFIAIKFILMG